MSPTSRTPEEIRSSIEAARRDLATSVEDLGSRVRKLTDWRSHLAEHRTVAIAAVCVAGFVAGGGVAALGSLFRRH